MSPKGTKEDLIYFAGFFDGEGCIGVWPSKTKSGWWYFQRRLIVVNTHEPTIDWIKERFGGNVKSQLGRDGRKDRYDWYISGDNSVELLKEMMPYLMSKREQAKLYLEFHDTIDRNMYFQGGLSDEVLDKRFRIVDKLRDLK